jgi:hypothetical protein
LKSSAQLSSAQLSSAQLRLDIWGLFPSLSTLYGVPNEFFESFINILYEKAIQNPPISRKCKFLLTSMAFYHTSLATIKYFKSGGEVFVFYPAGPSL